MNLLTLVLVTILTLPSFANEDINLLDSFDNTLMSEVLEQELDAGDIDANYCTAAPKRVWPAAEHIKFCMDDGPKLMRIMKNDDSNWNDQAIKLSLGWTLGEAGWKHFLNKTNNYCYWGFMKNEQLIPCEAKTMKEGFEIWRNYLTEPHDPPKEYVKKRSVSCGPHKALIKNFTLADPKVWTDDDLNLWMRALPHAGKSPKYYNDRNPGEVPTLPSGKPKPGHGGCTYNSVIPNYAGHIQSSVRSMGRYCKQIYDDIETQDYNGVFVYMQNKPNYEKVKHLITNTQLNKISDFISLLDGP